MLLLKNSFIVIVLLFIVFFSSCHPGAENNIPTVGTGDARSIPADSLIVMEKGFESSYEYAKTIVANEKLVYDIRAYGGPASEGEFAIIRRAADNKPDTIVKGQRKGIFVDAWLTHLTQGERNEIIIVNQSADVSLKENLLIYAVSKEGELSAVKYNPDDLTKEVLSGYAGKDSFYTEGTNRIIREYPFYTKGDKTQAPKGKIRAAYIMKDGELKRLDQEILPL